MSKKKNKNIPVSGIISVNEKGYGFITGDTVNVFVPPGRLGGAITGDTVTAVLDPQSDPARPSGSVLEITDRKFKSIVGCIVPWHEGWALRPLRREMPALLPLTAVSCAAAVPAPVEGNWAVAELPLPGRDESCPDGWAKLCSVLAPSGGVTADLDAIVAEFSLPAQYTEADEKSARELQPLEVRRRDCTQLRMVTIDPVDARDYDDALSCEIDRRSGNWEVGVHIADVACYVRNGGWLDQEARRRSFTSYLPGRTIPMLPRALANDLCSLRAGVERLAHSVFITVDPSSGEIVNWKRRHTLIKVTQRLCYEQVQQFIDGGDFAEAQPGVPELVTRLHHLSQLLRRRRFREERFLPMAMPEIRAVCSENPPQILGVQSNEDNPSHQLVEEFMLAANECVAKDLLKRHTAALFRNHQPPDLEKMTDFCRQVEEITGQPQSPLNTRNAVVDFLRKTEKSPLRDVLYMTFLRNLPRADYGVECTGHFGLGKSFYCHFTSPIRRYADLLVHQQLTALDKHRKPYGSEAVAQVAQQCCAAEYNCDTAEFAAEDRMKIRYIAGQTAKAPAAELSCWVCRVSRAGVGVYLPDYGLMGFISAITLPAGAHFDPAKEIWTEHRSGVVMRRGAKISCRVLECDAVRGELLLLPAGCPQPPPSHIRAAAGMLAWKTALKRSERPGKNCGEEKGAEKSRSARQSRRSPEKKRATGSKKKKKAAKGRKGRRVANGG